MSTAPAASVRGHGEGGGDIAGESRGNMTNVTSADAMAEDPRGAPTPRAKSVLGVWAELTKVRLNALVLLTTAVGYAVASPGSIDWTGLGWTCAGTALAAASASLFNQLLERRRDALMHRTRGRPLPARQVGPATVFVAAMVSGYTGAALLGLTVGLLPAALAAANILLYVLLYTPLKPHTTFNTLIGAVCGAIPPVIGWTAVTGSMDPGAWLLGGILFIWQIPHFLALAWLYREDYARGGHAMLPVRDSGGELTAQVALVSTLPLIPLATSATLLGLAGIWSAVVAFVAGIGFSALAVAFFRARDDLRARRLFLGSITYLPVVLGVMTLDRGPLDAESLLRGRGDATITERPAAEGRAP